MHTIEHFSLFFFLSLSFYTKHNSRYQADISHHDLQTVSGYPGMCGETRINNFFFRGTLVGKRTAIGHGLTACHTERSIPPSVCTTRVHTRCVHAYVRDTRARAHGYSFHAYVKRVPYVHVCVYARIREMCVAKCRDGMPRKCGSLSPESRTRMLLSGRGERIVSGSLSFSRERKVRAERISYSRKQQKERFPM